jgi:hypothetical protein
LKEVENEVIVTNVGLKGETIILELRFTKPKLEESTEKRFEKAIEPIPKSHMEQMGREVAKGYMNEVQKTMQQSMSAMQSLMPPSLPFDTIRFTLSKQEYEQLGRPTVFDKLLLTLKMKAISANDQ